MRTSRSPRRPAGLPTDPPTRQRTPALVVLAALTALLLTGCEIPIASASGGSGSTGSSDSPGTGSPGTDDPDPDGATESPTPAPSPAPTISVTPSASADPADETHEPTPTNTPTAAPTATRSPSPSPTPGGSPAPTPGTGGVPGAGNTGWRPTGVQLTDLECPGNGDLIIDRDGTVIDGRRIRCSIRVEADDVRITRSEVQARGIWGIYKPDQYRNLLIEDTEIVGGTGCGYGVGFTSTTTRRANIHGCSDGVHTENGSTLEDSWIHDLRFSNGSHNDGVQSTGSSNIVIRGNRIENPQNQTSCILIGGENGSPSNVLIENNYLDGGNYTIYLDPKGSNRTVRNNTFTRGHVYGPASVDGQVTWTGNRYTDGATVNP